MSWKEGFKRGFDVVYELVSEKHADIRYPCCGGRFYWFLVSRHFESLYFYLTNDSIIYTASSAYITEIPFSSIKKLSVKQGCIFKRSFNIHIVADKKYHFLVNDIKDFSTQLTGDGSENVKKFLETLKMSVE